MEKEHFSRFEMSVNCPIVLKANHLIPFLPLMQLFAKPMEPILKPILAGIHAQRQVSR